MKRLAATVAGGACVLAFWFALAITLASGGRA